MTFLKFATMLILKLPPLRDAVLGDIDNHEDSVERVRSALPFVIERLQHYRQAWVEHPQFEHLRTFDELSWLPYDDETWAEVVLCYQHDPGVEGRTMSYVVASSRDLVSAWHWTEKQRIGTFYGILPITEDFSIDPFAMVNVHSFTYEGRAKGYHCRMELKRLLPNKLRKYVSRYRRHKKMPKVHYLTSPLRLLDGRPYLRPNDGNGIKNGSYGETADWVKANKADLPDWYRQMTKAQLWVEWVAANEPEVYAQLDYWIGLIDFYMAVTGQVNPNDIEGMFKRLHKSVVEQPEQMVLL